jgi:hypothetical protein
MTYREQCNLLHKEAAERLSEYYKAEILSRDSVDEKLLARRYMKQHEWLEAENAYNDFLSHVARLGKSLDDKMHAEL